MTTEKQFICECGRTFTNGQSFNGHKSNCKVHHEKKYGTLAFLENKYKKASIKSHESIKRNTKTKKDVQLLTWLATKPTCEKCGKVMTEKFGSGRFCSRACANSRARSEETIDKIRISTSKTKSSKGIKQANIEKYADNPKRCRICGEIIEYDRRNAETCTNRECQYSWTRQQAAGKSGGFRLNSHSYGKHGTYKGYRCDSTYELAYIIYNLDHNIYFERNFIGYPYELDGKIHLYYPDFRLADGSLVEIKGQVSEIVYIKLKAIKDVPIKLLVKDDLKYAFDYVKDTYRCKHLEDLYE